MKNILLSALFVLFACSFTHVFAVDSKQQQQQQQQQEEQPQPLDIEENPEEVKQ